MAKAKAKKPVQKKPMIKGKGAKAPMPAMMQAAAKKSGKKKNPFGHEGK